jgi:hypothetical protein
MATETDQNQENEGRSHAATARAALAAAATGAAAYGVFKLRSHRAEEVDDDGRGEEETAPDEDDDSGDATGRRQELTEALATKVASAKNATSRLKPGAGSHSILESAWDAASEQLLPIAQDAAAALGATVARKVPDTVRDELMPRFIEGFQKGT